MDALSSKVGDAKSLKPLGSQKKLKTAADIELLQKSLAYDPDQRLFGSNIVGKANYHKEIIDSNYIVPSKVMVIQAGVELREPGEGRNVKGA